MHNTLSACFRLPLVAAAVGLISLHAGNAEAATTRTHYYSATGVCEAPLPSYDVNLRKRPLGITNQGTAPIFISCSVPADFVGDMATNWMEVGFTSMGGAGTATCTLVAGNRPYGSGSVAGSAAVAAGGYNWVGWYSLNKEDLLGSFNFSCHVPPGFEMNLIIIHQEDTGDGL